MFDTLWPELSALLQVLFIDIVLAGDNAVVVGMAAAGVPDAIRRKVILVGISAAVILRIFFAYLAAELLGIIGLTLAGGILLLWVCWKMYREIVTSDEDQEEAVTSVEEAASIHGRPVTPSKVSRPEKTFRQAFLQILIADVSMSLDNVLAVAGAARDHMGVLVIGLAMSVALMGAAASLIASMLNRHRWIAWLGLLVILYVAVMMVFKGAGQVACDGMGVCGPSVDVWLWSWLKH